MDTKNIRITGLSENNLKNLSFEIPKNRIVVFTGVSGSGKSSIVFDTLAAEASRQMNETYTAFIRNRLPKYPQPKAEKIENLSPAVIVDQTALGGNMRSTVGTASELYTGLRLLFSRIGQPYAGSASFFSFNDQNGMCPECSGLGKITDINLDAILDKTKSLSEGAVTDTTFKVGAWYYRLYANCGLFDINKPLNEYSAEEMNLLLYGAKKPNGKREHEKIEGLYNIYKKRYLTRDISLLSGYQNDKALRLVTQKPCPVCKGGRLNRRALSCYINGMNIAEMSSLEAKELRKVIGEIKDPSVKTLTENLMAGLTRMIDIGLDYLSLNRETTTLSGGEAQRLKLVRYLGSSLTDMLYIFDEPSAGMHPRDVYRMDRLLTELKNAGNSVIVVEHDKDVISLADTVIDIGPAAGSEGGQILFNGSYEDLLKTDTLTAKAMRAPFVINDKPHIPTDFLPVRNACLNNLKNVDVDIPLNVVCVVTGVAGSGKSSLISGVFAKTYEDRVVLVDQSPITATSRSTPASYLGFFDEIRKLFAEANNADDGLFSFNSTGACPVCGGRGETVTELVFMDPVVNVCEACGGSRYNKEALSLKYKNKNIIEVLNLTVKEASEFFRDNNKILRKLNALIETGLSYISLGQPLSTFSGGERHRIKIAKNLNKNGSIYILDEPTTGLHPSDTEKLMELFFSFAKKGSSVIIIEHNLDVIRKADYIIDIGPDAGKAGGKVVFAGTPAEMIENGNTITAECLRAASRGERLTNEELSIITKNYILNQQEENEMPAIKLEPIGRISVKDEGYAIELDKKYAPALKGLEDFSHIQVLWWFDMSDNKEARSSLTEANPYKNAPATLGSFATRSPNRANPIAVSTAGLIRVDAENAVLYIDYTDAFDGTPVLDIKPYTPSLDRVLDPKVPAWCENWPKSLEESGDFDWGAVFAE